MLNIQKIIIGVVMIFLLGGILNLATPVIEGAVVLAQSPDLGVDYPAASGLSNVDIRVTIAKMIRIALGLVGIVMVTIMIYAGFLWMTAGGNDEQIGLAKKWMGGAVIGFAILMSAYAITSFVISRLQNVVNSGEANVPLEQGPNIPAAGR